MAKFQWAQATYQTNVIGNAVVANSAVAMGNTGGIANVTSMVPFFNTVYGGLSLGNITTVLVSANLTYAGNALTVGSGSNKVIANALAGSVSATGNISGNYILGNGAFLTGVAGGSSYGDANVEILLASGNIVTDILTTGNISAAGNIYGGGLTINGDAVITGNTLIQGNLTYNNIDNLTTSNLVLGLGNNQTGINVTGGGIAVGNTNEATLLYDFTSQSWDTNINLAVAGNVTATGNIEGTYFIGNGSQLTGLPANYSNANVLALGESGWAGNILPTGNSEYNLGSLDHQWKDLFISNATIYLNGVPLSSSNANATPTLIFNNAPIVTSGPNAAPITTTISTTANVVGATLVGNTVTTVYLSAQGNVDVSGALSVQGNVIADNLSVVGTINLGAISVTGDVAGANVSATGTVSSGNVSTSGTVTTANVSATGNVSVAGNVTANTIVANTSTTTNLTVTNINPSGNTVNIGNVTFALDNVSVPGYVSAVGNITGAYFIGNGSQLTGLPASYGNANVAAYLPTYTGVMTAVGNIESANLFTGGVVSATGNIRGGNINTAGSVNASVDVSAAGNVYAGTEVFAQTGFFNANLYVGPDADATVLTNPVIIGRSTGATFIQAALFNDNPDGSADFQAYAANGTDTQGWVDVGMAGNTFSDPAYTITKSNDGYLFAQGVSGVGGNLVLATGEQGGVGNSDIVFAVNGFDETNEILRIESSANTVLPYVDDSLSLGSDTKHFANLYVGNVLATTSVSSAGNVNAQYINSVGAVFSGNISITGTVTAAGISGNITNAVNAITVTGNAQGNINSVGLLSGASVSGNILQNGAGNIISAQGNIYANNLSTTNDITAGGLFSAVGNVQINGITTISNNAVVTGNLTVQGNLVSVNQTNLNVSNTIIGLGRGDGNTPLTTNDGYDRGEQLWYYTGAESSAFIGWQNSTGNIVLASDASITNNIVTVNSYGSATVGNVAAQGAITATGNVTGSNLNTAGSVTADTVNSTVVSATANVTGGNLVTGGSVTATGNIGAGNLVTGGLVTAAGNVTAGNVLTAGAVSATGAVYGSSFVGIVSSGSIAPSYTVQTVTANAETIALSNTSSYTQYVVGGYAGTIVALPDATTATAGATYTVINNTGNAVSVQTSSGVVIAAQNNSRGIYTLLATANNNSNTWTYATQVSTGGNTGSGGYVLATAPTFTSGFDGSATFNAFASVNTLNLGNGITTLNLGGNSAVTSNTVVNLGVATVGAGNVKTVNIGTNGAANSTTAITIGTSAANATSNISLLGVVNTSSNVNVDGNVVVQGIIGVSGLRVGADDLSVTSQLVVTGPITGSNYISVAGNIYSNAGGSFGNSVIITSGNFSVAGNISAAGTITANSTITTTGSITAGTSLQAQGQTALYGSAVQNDNIGTGKSTGTIIIGGAAQTGTIQIGSSTANQYLILHGGITGSGNTKTIELGRGGAAGSNTNIIVGPTVGAGTFNISSGTTVAIGNTSGTALSVAGNITGGNLRTAGLISATGNVTGNYILGNVAFATGIPETYGNANVANYLPTYSGNLESLNSITATGNITASYFLGNGSQLSGIDATSIQNGTSNVRVANNGNVTIGVAGTSNVAVFTTTGINVAGNVSAGYVTVANAISIPSTAVATGTGDTTVYTASSANVESVQLTIRAQIGSPATSVQMLQIMAAQDSTGNVSYTVYDRVNTNTSVAAIPVTVTNTSNVISVSLNSSSTTYYTISVTEFANT